MANNAITINIAPPTVSVGITRQGAPGREIELQAADGYVQWRYVGYPTWTNLVALSALHGAVTFADAAARTASVPAWVGQFGYQLDTGILYHGTATSAGSWTAADPAMVGAATAAQGVLAGTSVQVTGTQSIAGAKTFTDLLSITKVPTGITPALSSLVVNPASASADALLVWLGVGDALRCSVDEDGDGYLASSLGINCLAPPTRLTVADTVVSSPRGIISWQVSNSVDGARLHLRKDRGTTVGTPAVVQTGDMLGRVVASGWDGANYLEMAGIDFGVSGTVGSTRIPSYMAFLTASNAAPSVLTERMRILNSGFVGINLGSPLYRLHVNGGTTTDSGAVKSELVWTGGGGAYSSGAGLINYCTWNGSVTGASPNFYCLNALNNRAQTSGVQPLTYLNSIYNFMYHNGTGTVYSAANIHNEMNVGAEGGSITNLRGVETTMANNSGAGGVVTNAYGYTFGNPTGAGAITNVYGLYLDNLTKGTALNYSIYSLGGTMYHAGKVGLGVSVPTALLHLSAGTATAGTAPLKLTTGVVNTTAELGAVEFTDPDIFFTVTDTTVKRKAFVLDDGTRLTSGKIPRASTNGRLIDGPTPLAGTKVYYCSDTSGGAVTRKLTFIDGILTAET